MLYESRVLAGPRGQSLIVKELSNRHKIMKTVVQLRDVISRNNWN